jgi:hypothetical protein
MVLWALGCAPAEGATDGGRVADGHALDVPFERPDVGSRDSSYAPGPGGCGFEHAAFCETFEDGPQPGGRSGELDPDRWSVVRGLPIGHGSFEEAFTIPPAWIGDCRADLSNTRVLPSSDALVCDPTPAIATRHLVGAVGAQTYGLSSYRIRQPFDFGGRTGTIKLDADLSGVGLGGWPAIVISEDPSPAPSFDWEERGSGPRNGVSIEFNGGTCGRPEAMRPTFYLFRDYVQTHPDPPEGCGPEHVETRLGSLNHVEIYLTQTHLEVWASDASPDGVEFPNFHLLASLDVDLPFSRGYVSLVARNHATLKYWIGAAWLTRWDNVAFDGPVVTGWREHSAPDSLTVVEGLEGCLVGGVCQWRGQTIREHATDEVCRPPDFTCEAPGEARNVGYVVPNADEAPISITIPAVRLEGATRARIVLAVDYPYFEWSGMFPPPTVLNLRHRSNGGPWHDRFVSDVEANAFAAFYPDAVPQLGAGLLNQVIEVDLAELREGDNTLELQASGTWTGGYRIAVTGIDLVLGLR